jgi:hypothetical protein
MVRSEVIEAIKTSIVDIEFIKKDGAVRLMTCTLREESLPAQKDMVHQTKKCLQCLIPTHKAGVRFAGTVSRE